MATLLNINDAGFADRFKNLLNRKTDNSDKIEATVAEILKNIKAGGDKALFDYAYALDKTDLQKTPLRVSPEEIKQAATSLSADDSRALNLAAERIRAYHEKLIPEGFKTHDSQGVLLGSRWTPLQAVGLYIPGGTAAYPSSFLMNAIPAQVAGVPRIATVTPAINGVINPIILATADLLGIDEIYRIGGAHAIAALAYGTESLSPVDKITGPGNAYVAAAKKQVFGTVGIDMIAGPSEVLIVADEDNNPTWLAADLLSQAEHDPAAQAILICSSAELATKVAGEVKSLLQSLQRKEIAAKSWDNFGAIITTDSIEQSLPLIDAIAPEHLQLAVENPHALMDKVKHAGAIFLGSWTPEAIGDYIAGPNHVLPTSGTARFAQGLGVSDFLKRTSFIECTPESFGTIGASAKHLADLEGLQAHSLSLDLRIKSNKGKA